MSTAPSSSVVLYGPLGQHVSSPAKRLSEQTGLCEIDARQFQEAARRNAEETTRMVVDKIQHERCRQGFALHHFPRDLPEQRRFEKELKDRFGPEHEFNNFSAVFLDVRQEEGERVRNSEPIYHRDNPEYDPYDPAYKHAVARPLARDTSNWLYDRPNLVSHFMHTHRSMAQVDAHQPAEQTVNDILRVTREQHVSP